jgi:hypothetical protein
MAEQNRVSREVATRAVAERPKQWMPPELLPEPDKEAGYAYRWIRVSMLNQADPRNLSAKIREGWEPVRVEEQPKFSLLIDPTSRFKDNIEIGGLLLCKAPEEFVASAFSALPEPDASSDGGGGQQSYASKRPEDAPL